jgi:transglutaminase-like putative cysteine protease
MQNYLKETFFLDFNHPAMDQFVSGVDASLPPTNLAIELYELVRNGFLYDPYHLDLRHDGLKASHVLTKSRAWCVEKATLLAALARKFNIPSRLGYAVVTNHIGVERLLSYLKRDEIVFHGYVELYLNNRWIKCTPAFDDRVCMMSGVEPLNWDGEHDSLFQEFEHGKRFMEYLHFYGEFDDVPIDLMNAEMKKYYPHLFEGQFASRKFSFYHL